MISQFSTSVVEEDFEKLPVWFGASKKFEGKVLLGRTSNEILVILFLA
jgi:hypothetical protein